MRIVYQGLLWDGTTSMQAAKAFARMPGVDLIPLDVGSTLESRVGLYSRIRWKLRWPVDDFGENDALLETAAARRPDVVIVDNSKVIRRETIVRLRKYGVRCVAFTTLDDILGSHNLSRPLQASLPEWDILFTTKRFSIDELRAAGVRHPVHIGESFDPDMHRPLNPAEVGDEFESFDLVFAGAYEKQRRRSLNALAEAGFKVVIYGGRVGAWPAVHPKIVMRESWFADAYTRALHTGKVALCFLRKLNRDRITQRTIEITAMGRAMLAEKTDEHDAHFADGTEYVGFVSDDDMIAKARMLVADERMRARIAHGALARCRSSDYSSDARARKMLAALRKMVQP